MSIERELYERFERYSFELVANENAPDPIDESEVPTVPAIVNAAAAVAVNRFAIPSAFHPEIHPLLHHWMETTNWNWDLIFQMFQFNEEPGAQQEEDEGKDGKEPGSTQVEDEGKEKQKKQNKQNKLRSIANLLLKKQTVLTKGKIQSGKSRFMLIMGLLLSSLGMTTVFVLRAYNEDRKQLHDNFLSMKLDSESKGIYFPFGMEYGNKKCKARFRCLAVLSNASQLKRVLLLSHIALIIDEVDAVDSLDAAKVVVLKQLQEKAGFVMGVSATILDALCKNDVSSSQMFTLPAPLTGYKGLNAIQFVAIQGEYSGTDKKPIFREENADLNKWLHEYERHVPFVVDGKQYPHMGLVTVSRSIEGMKSIQEQIRELDIVTLLHTGEELRFCMDGEFKVPLLYKKDGVERVFWKGTVEAGWTVQRAKPSLRSCIQYLKQYGVEQFPRILIISGDLAGRGLSFTSEDHEWHLTEQFFVCSDSCDEPELLQKIRLIGRYQDELPLTLYTTEAIWSDLQKADLHVEEIWSRTQSSALSSQKAMEQMSLHQSKFTKRHMTKHYGNPVEKSSVWDEEEWFSGEREGEDDMDAVAHKIESHLTRGNTCIASFLASLSPDKDYSRVDIMDLLTRANYVNPTSFFPSLFKNTGYGGVGGKMFTKIGNRYSIVEELKKSWKM
jgi:hypothetical protein